MKRLFSLLLLILTALLVFVGCNTNETEIAPTLTETVYDEVEIQKIKDYISEYYGISKKALEVKGDYIYFDKDVAFPIEGFWETYGTSGDFSYQNQNLEKKHYQVTLVSTPNPPRWITINVLSTTPSSWSSAIYDAAEAWNSLKGNVRFSVQSGTKKLTGAINLEGKVLSNVIIADGSFPSFGNPGSSIKINISSKAPTTNKKQKVYTMVHEIGHTIGFAHTDSNEGTLITNVTSSCKTKSDPNSIMRMGNIEWSKFSTCDKQAFDALY